MKKQARKTPDFKSEAEERAFWESHDSSDLVNWGAAQPVIFSNLKPSTKSISIRLTESMLERIKVEANKQDVPYQSLIKVWLNERLNKVA